jgi:putative transposase
LWCSLIHLLTERPVTPVPMLMTAAVTAAVTAVGWREWPLARSLNGWDEAVAWHCQVGSLCSERSGWAKLEVCSPTSPAILKSPRQAQRFLSAHSMIYGHFRPRRHLMTAAQYRHARAEAFEVWQRETCARTVV